MRAIRVFLAALCVVASATLWAQAPAGLAVDRLLRISGAMSGQAPPRQVAQVLFGIYDAEANGAPFWQEVQTLTIGPSGAYTVLLGATSADGVPVELFASGEPRWLSVQGQWAGAAEAPRTLLTSVPYALKAAKASDADTLGGFPASAFVRVRGAGAAKRAGEGTRPDGAADGAARTTDPLVSTGSVGRIGKFVSANDLGDSVMFENAGKVGVGTTTPADYLSVRFTDTGGAFTGYAVQNLGNTATSYSGMLFYDQNGALGQFQGFNNATHEYRINNIASGGSINFMLGSASRFRVSTTGTVADGGTNAGLTGTSASAGFRVAGVSGINTHPSALSLGVLGEATASPIGTGVNGFGSITGGYLEATGNPSGGFNPVGVYGVASGTVGTGVVGRGSATGVYAQATVLGGNGLVANAPALGFAIKAEGNVTQDRTAGGFVKAMAYVDAAGNVTRCFNSQASGASCGISVARPQTGQYVVDFGFQVNDRFYTAQASVGPGYGVYEYQSSTTTLSFGVYGSSLNLVDSAFIVIVY